MSDYNTIVLDVGKTNKKLFVYDSNLNCRNPREKGAVFPQVTVDGILCDDMPAIYEWMIKGLARAARSFDNIRCISIAAHGATIALLGSARDEVFKGDGGLLFPIVSYEQDISPEEEDAFYKATGATPQELQFETGTARFGWLVNHAKQIFYLRSRFPKRLESLTRVLMWPQYLGYLLTGQIAAEATYPGCHGYLLDINGRDYSRVADALAVRDFLPPTPFRRNWQPLGALTKNLAQQTGLPPSCIVTMGVHDSNAALVPYFARGLRNFVMQDSGTWVVTMSPRKTAEFAPDEIGREVFFNRSIYGDPVKTTIFRGGAEFDFFRNRVLAGRPHPDNINLSVLRQILAAREAFALTTVERGSGLFPNSVARLIGLDTVFADDAHAWTVVDLALALQGCRAITMAAGDKVEQIIIEGNIGRRNPLYRGVIATLFPHAAVSFGTAGGAPYGAAILGAAAVEGKRPEELADRLQTDLEDVPPLDLDAQALRAYAEAFLQQVEEGS